MATTKRPTEGTDPPDVDTSSAGTARKARPKGKAGSKAARSELEPAHMTPQKLERRAAAGQRPAYRPTKYTKERQGRILAGLRLGMPQVRAIELGGISKSTFHEWRQIGANKPPGHHLREFADGINNAYAQFEARQLQRIEKASRDGDASMALALLTRCHATRDDWAPPKQKIDHGGTVGFTLRDLEDIDKARLANKGGEAPASTAI